VGSSCSLPDALVGGPVRAEGPTRLGRDGDWPGAYEIARAAHRVEKQLNMGVASTPRGWTCLGSFSCFCCVGRPWSMRTIWRSVARRRCAQSRSQARRRGELGDNRLIGGIQSLRDLSACELVERLIAEVREFTGGAFRDDADSGMCRDWLTPDTACSSTTAPGRSKRSLSQRTLS